MKALIWHVTLDFSCKPAMKTLHNLSSIQVTKYSKPLWDFVGNQLYTSENIQPRTMSACISVDFRISVWVCLPLMHGSHGMVRELSSVISIPVTMFFLSIKVTTLALRWPRWQCQVVRLVQEVFMWATRAVAEISSPYKGKELMVMSWVDSVFTTSIFMT